MIWGQMAERLGSQAINRKVAGSVAGSIPVLPNDVVSLGKALHPTFLRDNVPVLTVSCSG